MIDLFQLTLERVHKVPHGWRWCELDGHDKPEDFILVRGAIPVGEYKSGKKKGRTKWPKELQTIWLRRREMDQVACDWEQETGKCHRCDGSGQECCGWSVKDGKSYRQCSRCGGVGKPETQQVTA